jgi:outer membrane protein OmpA-like peptidoglycan-associated protein
MSQKSDESQGFALLTVFSVVGLVVAGAVGLGSMKGGFSFSRSQESSAQVQADAHAPRIYFNVADATLPADANEALTRAADAARANPQVRVRIVPFHDATGDSNAHSELARNRAWRVHHALESNGVPPQQLVMVDPVPTTAIDSRDTRRVELQIR